MGIPSTLARYPIASSCPCVKNITIHPTRDVNVTSPHTLYLLALLGCSPSPSLAVSLALPGAPSAGPWALAAVLAPATEDAAAPAHGGSSMRHRTARRAAAPRPPPVRLPLRRPRAARAGGSARGRRRDRGVPRHLFVVIVAHRRAPRPPAAGRGEVVVVAPPTPAAREMELRGAGAPGQQARGPQWPQPGLQSVGREATGA